MKQPVRLCLTECIQTKVIDQSNTLPGPNKQTKVTIEGLAIEHCQTRRKKTKSKGTKLKLLSNTFPCPKKQTKNAIIEHLATERSLMQSGPSSCPYVDVQSDSQQLLNHPEVLTRTFVFGDKGQELHN